MQKSIDALHTELSKLRVGRATLVYLTMLVDYYGSPMPLTKWQRLPLHDARTLTVAPWEKTWSKD